MLRSALMTSACEAVGPAICSPLIMRSAPSHDSYWLKDGNSLPEKWAYFSSAACICWVPALGREKGRNSVSK